MATNNAVNNGLSGSTGTGSFVGSTSPSLTTPAIGTPSAGVLSSCTGYPTSALTGLGSNVAAFLATPSSANLAAALTDETGSGLAVFGTAPTLNQPNNVGTTTNDSAAAGSVGQFASSVIASGTPVALTNVTAANVTSLSLTAGDWDVWGNVTFVSNTGTCSAAQGWISSTSASQPDSSLYVQNTGIAANNNSGFTVPQVRMSLSGTTTVYLSALGVFTVGLGVCGALYARRRR